MGTYFSCPFFDIMGKTSYIAMYLLLGAVFANGLMAQAQYTDPDTSTVYTETDTIDFKESYYDDAGQPVAPTPGGEHRILSLDFNRLLGLLRGTDNDGTRFTVSRELEITGDGFFGQNVGIGTNVANMVGAPAGNTMLTVQSAINNRSGGIELIGEGGIAGAAYFINTSAGSMVGRSAIISQRGVAVGDTKFLFQTSNSGVPATAMTIDEDQNIGIGTTSPGARFSVSGEAAFTTTFDNMSGIFINNSGLSNSAGAFGAGIEFGKLGTLNVKKAAIVPVQDTGDNDTLGLAFFVSQDNIQASPVIEALRIESGGNVGIGTTNPGAKLEVLSDGSITQGAEIRLQHANNNSNDIVSTIDFANNIGSVAKIEAGTVGVNNSGYVSVFTDNAGTSGERVRVFPDGRVAIGTNPSAMDPKPNGLLVEGEICDGSGNCLGSSPGQYLGVTTGPNEGTYDGNDVVGYEATSDLCNDIDWTLSPFSDGNDLDARVCSNADIVNNASLGVDFTQGLYWVPTTTLGLAGNSAANTYFWVNGGAPGDFATVNDCQGRTTASAGQNSKVFYFTFLDSSAAGYKYWGQVLDCAKKLRYMCCTK